MAEDKKELTGEEKLLADVKNQGEHTAAEQGDENDKRTPEEKLLADMTKKLEEEKTRRIAVERERDSERAQKETARQDATSAVERKIAADKEAVLSSVAAAEAAVLAARKEWRDARDSGDVDKEEKAQMMLNEAQFDLRGANYRKGQFDAWEATAKTRSADIQDFKVGTGHVLQLPKSAVDWAKKHPKLSTDSEFTETVFDADRRAKNRGIKEYTSEYYDFLDKYIDDHAKEDSGDGDAPAAIIAPAVKKTERPSSSSAAPVGGSTGSTANAARQQSFRMTAEHREAARFTFPNDKPEAAEEKYAKRQVEIAERRKKGENI